jgi:hypothetical protein
MLRVAPSTIALVAVILLAEERSDFFKIEDFQAPIILTSVTALVLTLSFVPQMDLPKNSLAQFTVCAIPLGSPLDTMHSSGSALSAVRGAASVLFPPLAEM